MTQQEPDLKVELDRTRQREQELALQLEKEINRKLELQVQLAQIQQHEQSLQASHNIMLNQLREYQFDRANLHKMLQKVEYELHRSQNEIANLQAVLTVTKVELAQTDAALHLAETKAKVNTSTLRLRVLLSGILFLIASVLASFGVNLLTSEPSHLIGWVVLILAVLMYGIAVTLTLIFIGGRNFKEENAHSEEASTPM